MSELNFNYLPREILLKVFRFLDVVNLKNATLACQLWKNVIESDCRWSLELNYDINGKLQRTHKQKMNFILTTNRKFRTIEIWRGRLSKDNEILQMFQRHGFNVVNLNFRNCRMDKLASLAELLNLTPNLKRAAMSIYLPGVIAEMSLDQFLPDLKNFKNLDICGCDCRILKCLRKVKLTSIKFEDKEHIDLRHYDALVDFLSSQDMLTSLFADEYANILAMMGESIASIPFRLTKLRISGINGGEESSLLRFVRSQTESLKELELGSYIPNSVYECVFANMTQLNSLSVTISTMSQNDNFYEGLKENCSVRTLVIANSWSNLDFHFFHKFLQKLPNIRNLVLANSDHMNKTFLEKTQNFRKIESVSIEPLHGCSIDCVKFPNLKTLRINWLHGINNWNDFTKIHPRLTELIIRTISNESFLTSDDIDQIATNVDLQIVRLGKGFVADDRFFEIIRTKCKNLKVLDLHKSCIPDGLSQNVEINVLRVCDRIEMIE